MRSWLQLLNSVLVAAIDNTWKNKCGCISVKLYMKTGGGLDLAHGL